MSLLLSIIVAQAVDPYALPIGAPGNVVPKPGYTRTADGGQVGVDEIAAASKGVKYVLVGENHATPGHHQAQADIIRALVKSGRHVAVGMEMFTRDNQKYVSGLSSGRMTIEEFRTASNWDKQWGHDFGAYRPVLEAVKELGLPVVALNVPREWVRQVSRSGYASFDEFQKRWVPQLDLTNKNHRMVFDALMGGHPMPEDQARNIYSGQVTWDTGMANSAIDWMGQRNSENWVMVILAGSGHVMYGQAINYRIFQQSGERSMSVVCIQEFPSGHVSKGIGDFVFLGK